MIKRFLFLLETTTKHCWLCKNKVDIWWIYSRTTYKWVHNRTNDLSFLHLWK